MTDSEKFIRDAAAANQQRAEEIEEATDTEGDTELERRDHVYGGFVQPNVLQSDVDEDEAAAHRRANDEAQRDGDA